MRFIVAILFFVVAVVGVGLGVAQRTVLAPPDHVTSTLQLEGSATVTVIDGTALNAYDGRQTVSITGGVEAAPLPEPTVDADGNPIEQPEQGDEVATATDAIAAAYGRTSDVLAWVGDTSYNRVTFDAETGELVSELVRGSESTVPSPYGSDLWYGDYQAEGELGITVNVPDDISLLIVSDGTLPAPREVSVTWPLDASTPFSTLLILGGVGSLIIGLLVLLWALLHMRRQRGPRRKTPKMPKVPKPSRYRPVTGRSLVGKPKGRRAVSRMAAAGGLVLGGALMLGACTTGGAVTASPTPTPTEGVETPAVAVTEAQLGRIISRVGQTIAQADEENDPGLAATRLSGAALELREAVYEMREEDDDLGSLVEFPQGDVQLTLPQRLPAEGDTWPRAVFAIVQEPPVEIESDEEGEEPTIEQDPPLALVLVQSDPRSQYTVAYAVTVTLAEGQERPEVAPAALGAPVLPPETPLLAVTPAAVAEGYADVLLTGEESDSYAIFQTEGDTLIEQIGAAAKRERRDSLPETATIRFSTSVADQDIISFVTNDGGALVTFALRETERVVPTQAGAAINAPDAVAALAGVEQSTRGIIAAYGIQVLFYVPPVGSTDPVVLLGYTQGLVNAVEVDE